MRSRFIRRRLKRTTIISIGCAAFLAGLGLAKLGLAVPAAIAIGSTGLVFLCAKRVAWLSVAAIVLCGLLLGLGRGGEMHRLLLGYDRFFEQQVTVTGTVQQDATYGKKRQIEFMIDHVTVQGQKLPGQVRVTSFSPFEPKQGDRVEVSGKLRSGFGNYQAGMYFAQINNATPGESWLANVRRTFSAVVLSVVPEPQASLGLGFLLGIKSQLPDDLIEQLKIVGLTHIVVASGYNLTILVRAARRALVRYSKYLATLAAFVMTISFLGVTGLSPSMSRAALVTSLSLVAWYYGRVVHPVTLLLTAAAVTAGWNPLYIWGDLGWYLSFLAFAGVMLGAPLLQRFIFQKRKVPQLAQIGIETLCAELATLPLTLLVFGSVSMVGLLANVLVVPVVPLAMLATFAGGLSSLLLPSFGTWLALPAHLILGYIIGIVDWLSAVPWARERLSLTWIGMVLAYVSLLTFGWFLWRRTKYSYLDTTIVE